MNKTVFLLISPPLGGKTTFAQDLLDQFPETIYLNADTLRQAMTGDISDQSQNGLVFRVFDAMFEYFMILGKNIIIDNCNVSKSYRKKYIAAAKENGYVVDGFVFDVTLETLLERNNNRERKVPEEVIKKFYFMLGQNFPVLEEGFDHLEVLK